MTDINFESTMNDFSTLNDYFDGVPDFNQFEPFFDSNAASEDSMPSEVRAEAPTDSGNLVTHPDGLNDQVSQPCSIMSPQITLKVVQETTTPDLSPAVAPPPGPSPAMAAPPVAQMQQQMDVSLNVRRCNYAVSMPILVP